MKIRGKLGAGFGVLIVAMLGIAIFSLVMLTRLSKEWTHMSEVIIKRNEMMIETSALLVNATLHFKNYIFRGNDLDRFKGEMDSLDRVAATYQKVGDVTE